MVVAGGSKKTKVICYPDTSDYQKLCSQKWSFCFVYCNLPCLLTCFVYCNSNEVGLTSFYGEHNIKIIHNLTPAFAAYLCSVFWCWKRSTANVPSLSQPLWRRICSFFWLRACCPASPPVWQSSKNLFWLFCSHPFLWLSVYRLFGLKLPVFLSFAAFYTFWWLLLFLALKLWIIWSIKSRLKLWWRL